MNKKFIVRLSDEERAICQEVVKKLKGSSEKVRRAQILLKADADGPGWPPGPVTSGGRAQDTVRDHGSRAHARSGKENNHPTKRRAPVAAKRGPYP